MFGNFFKSEYAYFMKYYLYFIVLFCITTYANLYISKETTDIKVFEINKVCFYMFFLFLCIIINDILDTPMMFLKQFIFIILFSLLLVYITNYFMVKYSKKKYTTTLFHSLGISLIIYVIFIIGIHFLISSKGYKYTDPLYLQFNYGIYVNLSFFIFTALYYLFLRHSAKLLDWNSFIGNLMAPTIFGLIFLFYLFCLIIYFAIKSKFITKIQSLNTFIAISCIILFLGLIQLYFFMGGLSNVCNNKTLAEERGKSNIIETLNLLLFLSIIFILWVDDSRKWNQLEYFLYIIVSIFIIMCIVYYSALYPSISLLSLWGFTEWSILNWYNNHDTWNSFNFMLMDTKYNLIKK